MSNYNLGLKISLHCSNFSIRRYLQVFTCTDEVGAMIWPIMLDWSKHRKQTLHTLTKLGVSRASVTSMWTALMLKDLMMAVTFTLCNDTSVATW